MANASGAAANDCKSDVVVIDAVVLSGRQAVPPSDHAVAANAGQAITCENSNRADEANNAEIDNDNVAREIGLMLVRNLRQAKLVRILPLAFHNILNPPVYRLVTLRMRNSVLFKREFRLSCRYLISLSRGCTVDILPYPTNPHSLPSHSGPSSPTCVPLRCLCPFNLYPGIQIEGTELWRSQWHPL